MTYPQIIDYNEAVQDPGSAFTDTELRNGKVAETPLGLPLALSGGFALTYTLQTGQRKYAVRCFHREVPNAQRRYAAISSRLRTLASTYFVSFDFQSQGIRVRGTPYPIVKMDWVEGDTLGVHLDRVATNGTALAALRRDFAALADFLERSGIAHGDIQNDNVMVQQGAIRLIDYDGMFVSGMVRGQGSEVGQKSFQHPRREAKHFGLEMDRFSFIVVDVSLEALIADSSLHRRFREGGQTIIFGANDFADPASSEIFQILNGMPTLRDSARKLMAVASGPITSVPTLADFKGGRNIPPIVAPPPTPVPKPPPTYISTFKVVDAKDFPAVLARVGDKIELVGKIVSVFQGVGRRGRGRGLQYVFINFGIWNQESVKVTIWSEGLGNLSTRPNASWHGKWISVIGLVEPPYEGKHYGKPYRNVGITVISENQIVHLSEQDARFRLGGKAGPSTGGSTKNKDILDRIRGTQPDRRPSGRLSTPSRQTTNQQILQTLKRAGSGPSAPSRHTTPNQHQSTSKGRIPWWVWIVGGLVILYLLANYE